MHLPERQNLSASLATATRNCSDPNVPLSVRPTWSGVAPPRVLTTAWSRPLALVSVAVIVSGTVALTPQSNADPGSPPLAPDPNAPLLTSIVESIRVQ